MIPAIGEKNYQTKRQRIETVRGQLDLERSSFIPHWREIAEMMLPRRQRFTITDNNKGGKVNQKILDGTGTFASKTLRAGMMGGVTSPARPWFKLTTADPKLAEFGRVKQYLYDTQQIMAAAMSRSNVYKTLPIMYGDGGTFGTSPMFIEEVIGGNVMNTSSFAVGSYMIMKDDEGRINGWIYDYRMTVRQLVAKFGKKKNGKADWSNFSTSVRNAWEAGQTEQYIDISHAVLPNDDFDGTSPWSHNKKWTSCYYERGSNGGNKNVSIGGYLNGKEDEIMLSEKGYDYFPVLCQRWETTGEDVYGTDCPGMTALGDVKQLQLGEKRSLEAIEKKVRPAMIAPTAMRGKDHAMLPGSTIYADTREGMLGFRPAFQVDFQIQELEGKQQQVRERINKAFYADLFLMLSNMEQRERTAYEISERKEEKLLVLGPVLEQLNQDVLDPLIDMVFGFCLSQRLLPEAPPELQGMPLKIEYVSVFAQAQKLIGIATIDRFVQSIGVVAQYDQRILRKVKTEQLVDVYGDVLSVPPSLIRSDEEMQALDQAEASAQAEQRAMQQLQVGAATAESLAKTPTTGDNALKDMMAMAQAGQ